GSHGWWALELQAIDLAIWGSNINAAQVVPKGFDLWDIATGKRTRQATDVRVYRLAFSPDGKTLAAGCVVQFVGFDYDVLAGFVLVAADDDGAVDGSVHVAVLGVADALAAVGVEQVGRRHVSGADGGICLVGKADQTEYP